MLLILLISLFSLLASPVSAGWLWDLLFPRPPPPPPYHPPAPVVTVAPPGELVPLAFDNPSPSFDMKLPNTTLKVRLAQATNGTVTVDFQGFSVRFKVCRLQFNATTWDKFQSLEMMPVPFLTSAAVEYKEKIAFATSSCDDPKFNNKLQGLLVVRPPGSAARCTSFGDPHYKGFSSDIMYSFMGSGTYYLVRSPSLVVQYISQPMSSAGHSYNTAVAIQYARCVLILSADDFKLRGTAYKDCGLRVYERGDESTKVYLPEGSRISVTRVVRKDTSEDNTRDLSFLNIEVELAYHHIGEVSGVCGPFTGSLNKDLFFQQAKLTAASLPSALGEMSRVSPSLSLFTCEVEKNCTSLTDTAHMTYNCTIQQLDGCNRPSHKPEEEPLPVGFTPASGVEEVQAIPEPPANVTGPPAYKPTPEFEAKISEACKNAIDIGFVKKIVDAEYYVKSCISDLEFAGNMDDVEKYKRLYFSSVNSYVQSAANNPIFKADPKAAELIKKVVEELGLVGWNCPGDCNGNGQCTGTGCACKTGWTGAACNETLSSQFDGDKFTKEVVKENNTFQDLPPNNIYKLAEEAGAVYSKSTEYTDFNFGQLSKDLVKETEEMKKSKENMKNATKPEEPKKEEAKTGTPQMAAPQTAAPQTAAPQMEAPMVEKKMEMKPEAKVEVKPEENKEAPPKAKTEVQMDSARPERKKEAKSEKKMSGRKEEKKGKKKKDGY